MKQDHQHIDKKLRELENQSLPDLSRIDEHWQQFSSSLQPVSSHARAPRNYTWWIVAAVITSSIIFIAAYIANNRTEKEIIVASLPKDNNEQTNIDTVPTTATPATRKIKKEPRNSVTPASPKKSDSPVDTISVTKKNPVKKLYGTKQAKNDTLFLKKKNPTKTKRVLIQVRTSDGKDTVLEAISTEEIIDTSSTSRADKLENFFRQMEKEAQVFIIDNNKDTILIGKEGTALLIPANAFTAGKRKVSVELKEYYSYEDIITNRLSTTSNGELLITGGMIHISAQSDSKEVKLRPNKSIRWFIPHKDESLNGMNLFTSEVKNNNSNSSIVVMKDSLAANNFRSINWQQREQAFITNYTSTTVKVLDLRNDPFRVKQKANGEIAYFGLAPNSVISKNEAAELLQEKYGYYKVKIKKIKPIDRSFIINFSDKYDTESIGDSAWVAPFVATTYKLKSTETRITTYTGFNYTLGWIGEGTQVDMNSIMQELSGKFSVDISTMGWLNCDKFYDRKMNRIDYYVDVKDKAENYHAMLVFKKMKGMIPGQIINKRIVFFGVPEGESAIVVLMGIQNGKTVSAMQSVNLSKTPLTNLKFEETTTREFKEQVSVLDK